MQNSQQLSLEIDRHLYLPDRTLPNGILPTDGDTGAIIALPHEPSGLTKATWTDADFVDGLARLPHTYTQYLRRPPQHVRCQWLTSAERGGLSFTEQSFV